MPELKKIYRCEECGDMIEVLKEGCGNYSCHGEPMKLLDEQTADYKTEKHVPMIEKIEGGFKVIVGSTPHPMEEDHYIEWIEITDDAGRVYRKHLKPGDVPEAIFMVDSEKIAAREHCNVHGLWKGE
ncbi:desulfoferrodoxin [candidate division TA06 bacterium B3_TA06]|uniref:Desulfoferrodoxin n=1 Tax=candidate division TA06 bacterium B3_TA06 TaxID=2012487 RepID=A0A532V8X5_UNCT6|nr:MAG: desulfoferrodoxin [candidate division TA06 bacterium B3_TA06]